VSAVDLFLQAAGGIRAGGAEGFAVVVDGSVRMNGERLRGFEDSTSGPFEVIGLGPGLAGGERGSLMAHNKREEIRMTAGAGFDLDGESVTGGGFGGVGHGEAFDAG
jgi:hypothetical protein